MSSTPQTATLSSLALLEARLGARLAGALTAHSLALPHDINERLRFAREKSLAVARESRARIAAGTVVAGVSAQGSLVLGDFLPWWQRAASVLPLLVLVAGLAMIDNWSAREQVLAAAEIDAQLLSDALPPAAYSDPGFGEYLRNPPTP